jgi:GxxExxY protein
MPIHPHDERTYRIIGAAMGGDYFINFVCFAEVVVEVKATSALTPADQAQVLNYLALHKKRVGLLLNFGATSLQYNRFVLDVDK